MKSLLQILDANRHPVIGLCPSDYVNAVVLVAGTAQTQAVPAGAKHVMFSSTADFYVNMVGATAATVPGTAVTAGTACVLNPQLRAVDGATVIGIVSPSAAVVTMEYYG